MFCLNFFGRPSCLNRILASNQSDKNNFDFLNLPADVIREILKRCDLVSILNLTKVCRALYHFIYRLTPTAIVERMTVTVNDGSIYIYFENNQPQTLDDFSKKIISLSFHYHENGCVIRNPLSFILYVEDEDFLSVACNYLRLCLQCTRTIIHFQIEHRDFGYRWDPKFSFCELLQSIFFAPKTPSFKLTTRKEMRTTVWETIEECLESRIHPLQVRKLIMKIRDSRIHILNLLNSEALRELEIEGCGRYPEFDVKRLKNLERLSMIKKFYLKWLCVSNPIRDFFHISSVYVTVETISDKEILEIRNEWVISESIKKITIKVTQGESCREQLSRLFRPPLGYRNWHRQSEWSKGKWSFLAGPNRLVICEASQASMKFSHQ